MIRETIKKIHNKILVRKNIRWSEKHGDELNQKYNGKLLLIVDCRVVAVGSSFSDMPNSDAPGALYCQTNIVDPCKYFGIKRADFGVIIKEK